MNADLSFFPYHTSTLAPQIVTPYLIQICNAIQTKSCLYHCHTDDFGIGIKTLLMSRPNQPSNKKSNPTPVTINITTRNMQIVCKELGIELKFSHEPYHLRDIWIRSPTGDILNQRDSIFSFLNQKNQELLNKALEKTIDFFLIRERSGFARSTHALLRQGIPGNFYDSYDFIQNDEIAYFKNCEKKFLSFYGEGGNVLKLTGKDGKVKILFGEFQFYMTLHTFLLEKEMIEKSAATPFSEYLIKKYIMELSRENTDEIVKEMAAQGLMQTFDPDALDPEKFRVEAARYAWQKLYIRGLISANFNVPHEDVLVIPQIYYHLDYFLKSGPCHSLFINSQETTARLLEDILQHSGTLGLTEKDMKLLHQYIQTAWKIHKELDPLFKETCSILETAGLTPIPAPGIFLFEKDSGDSSPFGNINFLNALSGWSAKKKNFYYLTTGAQVGDNLGAVFMDIFDTFLQSIQPGIEVYFLGRPEENLNLETAVQDNKAMQNFELESKDCVNLLPSTAVFRLNDFSEPMAWWNTTLAQFGIHCLTIELETESHSTYDS